MFISENFVNPSHEDSQTDQNRLIVSVCSCISVFISSSALVKLNNPLLSYVNCSFDLSTSVYFCLEIQMLNNYGNWFIFH